MQQGPHGRGRRAPGLDVVCSGPRLRAVKVRAPPVVEGRPEVERAPVRRRRLCSLVGDEAGVEGGGAGGRRRRHGGARRRHRGQRAKEVVAGQLGGRGRRGCGGCGRCGGRGRRRRRRRDGRGGSDALGRGVPVGLQAREGAHVCWRGAGARRWLVGSLSGPSCGAADAAVGRGAAGGRGACTWRATAGLRVRLLQRGRRAGRGGSDAAAGHAAEAPGMSDWSYARSAATVCCLSRWQVPGGPRGSFVCVVARILPLDGWCPRFYDEGPDIK
jgi:hypothetical protein